MPAVEYAKDKDGRIAKWCGGELTAASHDDTGKAILRNHSGRVYCKNGETITVKVDVNGTEYVVASGIAKAEFGKMCAALVRVRFEADVNEPLDPAEQETE